MSKPPCCPFCERVASSEPRDALAVAIPDSFPLNPGHTLVVPRRHVVDVFELTPEEQAEFWRVVAQLKARLEHDLKPDGFTIGANVGAAAGQTVDHAHVHVIPRFEGDVADPRGGVRWVIPSRAAYWKTSG